MKWSMAFGKSPKSVIAKIMRNPFGYLKEIKLFIHEKKSNFNN